MPDPNKQVINKVAVVNDRQTARLLGRGPGSTVYIAQRSAQQVWPVASLLSTHVPLIAGQHPPLQWPAEPGGPAPHPYVLSK